MWPIRPSCYTSRFTVKPFRPLAHRFGAAAGRVQSHSALPACAIRGAREAAPQSSVLTRYLNLIAHVPDGHEAVAPSLETTVTEVGAGNTDLPLTKL
jgi:hypothetical protein